jgi:hypothetical protein|tara:strand:- start:209 stop:424 length:216 start_codon:yes stop_codon:yes gene_type:complete
MDAIWMTYGQWLHIKMTSVPDDLLAGDQISPLESGSAKEGSGVPRGTINDGVSVIAGLHLLLYNHRFYENS